MKENEGIGLEIYEAAVRAFERAIPLPPLEEAQQERARNEFKFFSESCFYDDNKKPIRQAPHHDYLQTIIDTKRRAVILYPVGFGKTTQIIMRIIWELGRDPSLRIIVVSSKGTQAKKIVSTVAREISSNPLVRAVFPDLKPAKGSIRESVEHWSGQSIRVHGAPFGQKDPSVAAYGLDGSVSGSRADMIFGDNMMDFENTSSRHQRGKSIERFTKEVMTRLVPGGRAYVTDTAWTKDDLPHTLMKRPSWESIIFDAEVNPFGEGVLWEDRFPKAELDSIKADIGSLAYDLTYRNKPMSDSMGIFESVHVRAAVGRCEWLESYSGSNRIITGMDLAVQQGEEHDLTVLITVEDCGDIWKVRHIYADRLQAGGIIRAMIDIARRFHFNAPLGQFIVENNAAQDYIVQMAKDGEMMAGLGVKPEESTRLNVSGRATTRLKRDLEFGIPRIAADLEMGRWEFPDHPEVESLAQEMLEWIPDLGFHSGDRLMAMWQARSKLDQAVPKVIAI